MQDRLPRPIIPARLTQAILAAARHELSPAEYTQIRELAQETGQPFDTLSTNFIAAYRLGRWPEGANVIPFPTRSPNG